MISSANCGVGGKLGAAGLDGRCAAETVCKVSVTGVAGAAVPAGSVAGENVAVAPEGNLVAENVTGFAKLSVAGEGTGIKCKVTVCPAEAVCVAVPETAKVKSADVVGAVTVSVSTVAVLAVKFESPL